MYAFSRPHRFTVLDVYRVGDAVFSYATFYDRPDDALVRWMFHVEILLVNVTIVRSRDTVTRCNLTAAAVLRESREIISTLERPHLSRGKNFRLSPADYESSLEPYLKGRTYSPCV